MSERGFYIRLTSEEVSLLQCALAYATSYGRVDLRKRYAELGLKVSTFRLPKGKP